MKNKIIVIFDRITHLKKSIMTIGIMMMLFVTQTVKTHAVVGDMTQKVVNSFTTEINGGIIWACMGLAGVTSLLLFFQQKKLAKEIFFCGIIGIILFKFQEPIGNFINSLG